MLPEGLGGWVGEGSERRKEGWRGLCVRVAVTTEHCNGLRCCLQRTAGQSREAPGPLPRRGNGLTPRSDNRPLCLSTATRPARPQQAASVRPQPERRWERRYGAGAATAPPREVRPRGCGYRPASAVGSRGNRHERHGKERRRGKGRGSQEPPCAQRVSVQAAGRKAGRAASGCTEPRLHAIAPHSEGARRRAEHGVPLTWAPGFTHSPNRIGVVAIVTVTITSAPTTASRAVPQTRTAPPTELASLSACCSVRLHSRTCGGRTRISPGALRAEARPTVLLPADGFGVGFFFSIPSYDTREAICRVGGPTCRATLGSQDCPRTAALLSTNK